jgi:hypothetical protein
VAFQLKLQIAHQKTVKIMQKKFISDLPTLIFSRYETGTTGIFLGLMTDDFTCQMESADNQHLG